MTNLPLTIASVLRDELRALRPEKKTKAVDDGPKNGPDSAGSETSSKPDGDANSDITPLFHRLHEAKLTALCLSGGGIRSATFALGIIQSLASKGILSKLDYLSTVSGGGYIGTWLSAWVREELLEKFEDEAKEKGYTSKDTINDYVKERLKGLKELSTDGIEIVERKLKKGNWPRLENLDVKECDPQKETYNRLPIEIYNRVPISNPEPRPLRHLREYSNYMTPKVGLFSADTWALFGIYLRNLLLNWTIYLPLLAAVLLLPPIFRSIFQTLIDPGVLSGEYRYILLGLAVFFGIFSFVFVASRIPSKNPARVSGKFNSDSGVLLLGVLPQLLSAICAAVYWWKLVHYNLPDGTQKFDPFQVGLLGPIAFTTGIFVIGYVIFLIAARNQNKDKIRPSQAGSYARGFVFGVITSVVGGLLLRLLSRNLLDGINFLSLDAVPVATSFLCVAVPLFLSCNLVQSAVFIGLASGDTSDDDREWVARFGGTVLLISLFWLLFNGGVLILPGYAIKAFQTIANTDSRWFSWIPASIGSIITVVSAAASLFGGFSSKFPVRKDPDGSHKLRIISAIPQVASGIFLTAIFVAISVATTKMIAYVSSHYWFDKNIWFEGTDLLGLSTNVQILSHLTPLALMLWTLGLIVVGSFMAFFVNVNRFSLHGAYRDRLVRAYLGASNLDRKPNSYSGFDENDNRQLHRLKRQRPFHVLNATLNLVASKNLAWQNRKATSFTMTPFYCGSETLGYRPSNEYSRKSTLAPCEHLRYCNVRDKSCKSVKDCQLPGKSLRLGTAMAISGAAADPNMGYYSSALVTFVMSLFNIRLGWWLGNTGCVGSRGNFPTAPWFPKLLSKTLGLEIKEYYKRTDPTFAVWPLINETFGRTSEERRYLNVTDGGHFENLALYEMIRRRCRLIILSDAAADGGFTFGELSNAIEKCQVDLGVKIKVPEKFSIYSRKASEAEIATGRRFFVAEIVYPEQSPDSKRSWLIYCRPTLYDKEPIDIRHYARANESFPHQSTGDQFFDERQFEAYRKLGRLTFDDVADEPEVAAIFRNLDIVD